MEEILQQLLEEVRNMSSEISELRKIVDSQGETISELRNYISENIGTNNITNNEQEIIENVVDDVVRGSETINPNEPKDIMVVDNNKFKVDDSLIYGTDKDNYNANMNKEIVKNYLSKEEEKANEANKEEKLNDDKYISGTNFPKPRDRYLLESDEDYENFLKEHYNKYFPETKEISVLNNDEPKGLAVIDDVAKNDAVKSVERALNNEYEDIFSNSSKVSAPIMNKEPEKKEEKKSKKIIFDSEEEKELFEKNMNLDYKKDKNKNSSKIKKIRKGLKKFKDVLKKHGKKIIAGILVATATIGAAISIKGCSYDKKDIDEVLDNTKSNSLEYDSTVPSTKKADDISAGELNKDDIVNKVSDTKKNDKFDLNDLNIGDSTKLNGDYLYYTADDAFNNTNALKPDLDKNSKRTISLINFVSPDGTITATAHTKEEADNLRASGWIERAYNFTNDTYNVNVEGWVPEESLEKVK